MDILCNPTDVSNTTPSAAPSNIADQAAPRPLPASWFQSLPGEELTTPDHVYEASLRLVEAGLSVIPIDAEMGSKKPDHRRLPRLVDPIAGKSKSIWKIFYLRPPTAEVLAKWHDGGHYGLAVVGGAVSGGLE